MKRNDLQCVRGLAIISVLLFHFFPQQFPNGYVGVDQFFVLSGFLMMMIYGSKNISLDSTKQFYYRRIKRIIPLYALVIFSGLVAVYYLFDQTFWKVNVEAAEIALVFGTNLGGRDAANKYFTELQEASDLFTHTWSLGVEMQFYLIAPIFFVALSLLTNLWLRTIYITATMIASLAYHLLADATTSFNSPLCRMWQFEVGIASFIVGTYLTAVNGSKKPTMGKYSKLDDVVVLYDNADSTDNEEVESNLSRCVHSFHFQSVSIVCSGVLLILSFYPSVIDANVIRILTTACTGLLIAVGSQTTTVVFNNRGLTYIGDISYSLYLIHWPVYCYVKNNLPEFTTVYFVAMIVCGLLAVVVTETYEKFYLSLERRWVYTYITLFYALTIAFILLKANIETTERNVTDDVYGLKIANTFTKERTVQTNNMFDRDENINLIPKNCYPNTSAFGYCKFENHQFGRVTNLSIFVVGNSYSANAVPLVNKHFGPLARSIEKLCRPLCEALIEAPKCAKEFKEYSTAIVKAKPDVMFIIARHVWMMIKPIKGKLEDDPYLKQAWSKLQEYEKLVGKRIYILNSFPIVKSGYMKALNNLINAGKPINASTMIQNRDYLFGEQRMAELQKRCTKCVVFSYIKAFTDKNGERMVIDPQTKLSLYTSVSHLSPVGLEYVEPIFADLAKQLKDDLTNNML